MVMTGKHLFENETDVEEAYLDGEVNVAGLMLEKGNRQPKSESMKELPLNEPKEYLLRYPNEF